MIRNLKPALRIFSFIYFRIYKKIGVWAFHFNNLLNSFYIKFSDIQKKIFETKRGIKKIIFIIYLIFCLSTVFAAAHVAFANPSPSILLSPSNGPIGTQVTLSGNGFAANSIVTIEYDGNTVSTSPSTITTTSTGTFTATFIVPSSPAGSNKVTATDSYGNTASATFTIVPSIYISPSNGPIGTQVTLSGNGFAANSIVTIEYDGNTVSTSPSTITTTSTGTFTATFIVPSSPAGSNKVTATDSYGNTASATFTIVPSIYISPSNGPIGTNVTVLGYGFAANSKITIYYDGAAVSTFPSIVNTSKNGSFVASFMVPNSPAGTNNITAKDAFSDKASATFTVTSSTVMIYLSPYTGSESLLPGDYFVIYYTVNGKTNVFNDEGGIASFQADIGSTVYISAKSAYSSQNVMWVLALRNGSPVMASFTVFSNESNTHKYYYYEVISTSIDYQTLGSALPSAIYVNYTTAPATPGLSSPVNVHQKVSTNPLNIWSIYGDTVSITKEINGINERWITPTSNFTSLTSGSFTVIYYQQYSQKIMYEETGSIEAAPPVITYEYLGKEEKATLTTLPKIYWMDAGSTTSVPFLLQGSNSTVRWITSVTSWTIEGSDTVSPIINYFQQFYVNLNARPSAGGSVEPASAWYNMSSLLTIKAQPSPGWDFVGWKGNAPELFSSNKSVIQITLNYPINETAIFDPTIMLKTTSGGNIKYNYGTVYGTVKQNSSEILIVPVGTNVTLKALPNSFLYVFSGWNGFSSKSNHIWFIASGPIKIEATFVYNSLLLTFIILAIAIVTIGVFPIYKFTKPEFKPGDIVEYEGELWIVEDIVDKKKKIYKIRRSNFT